VFQILIFKFLNCLWKQKTGAFPAFGYATCFCLTSDGCLHGRMARGGHGLPNGSPRTAISFPFTPCRRATPQNSLTAVSRMARLLGGSPTAALYPFVCPTPYSYGCLRHSTVVMGFFLGSGFFRLFLCCLQMFFSCQNHLCTTSLTPLLPI
jgi:hypothetical protein